MFSFFEKKLNQAYQNGFDDGQEQHSMNAFKERQKFRLLELEHWIRLPIICISNEWDDPIIGFGVRVEMTCRNKDVPILVMKDYVTNKEVYCNGVIMEFTSQRFNAIYKLDPFELCSLVYRQYGTFNKEKKVTVLTQEEMINKLNENHFFTDFEKYQESERVYSDL